VLEIDAMLQVMKVVGLKNPMFYDSWESLELHFFWKHSGTAIIARPYPQD